MNKNRNIDQKRTYVNPDLCIACGSCVMIDDTGTFYMDDDGFANTKENNLELAEPQMCCPTAAIFIKSLEEYQNHKKAKDDE